jgi:putative flippase GtrA
LSPHKSSETLTFVRFCTVGGFGFAVDAGVLAVLTMVFGIGPIAARVVSGTVSMLSTWAVHRSYTFRSRDPGRLAEGWRFATVTITGVAINFAVYWCVLTLVPGTPPLLALSAGSAVAMGANYLGSRVYAFRRATAGSL